MNETRFMTRQLFNKCSETGNGRQAAGNLRLMPKPRKLSTVAIENFDIIVLDVRTGAEFGAIARPERA